MPPRRRRKQPRPVAAFVPSSKAAAPPPAAAARELILRRPSMLRETGALDRHSHSVLFSQIPRWGLDPELLWRRKRLAQIDQSRSEAAASASRSTAAFSFNAATAGGARPASAPPGGRSSPSLGRAHWASHSQEKPPAETADREERFRQLGSAGAQRLTEAERVGRQVRCPKGPP